MIDRRVLIVEDEFIIAEHLRVILQRYHYTVLTVAARAADALAFLEQGPNPDLVLLDIMLQGELDGIDLAHRLRAVYGVPFVFVTSHTDPVTLARAKHTQPHGYLVKPFTEQSVYAALEMAFAHHAAENTPALAPIALSLAVAEPIPVPAVLPDSLFVRAGTRQTRVRFHEIRWLEAAGNYTTVQTTTGRYTVLGGLKETEAKLPAADFVRIHKSYVVALGIITAVEPHHVLIGEHRIPVGRAHHAELMLRINRLQNR